MSGSGCRSTTTAKSAGGGGEGIEAQVRLIFGWSDVWRVQSGGRNKIVALKGLGAYK